MFDTETTALLRASMKSAKAFRTARLEPDSRRFENPGGRHQRRGFARWAQAGRPRRAVPCTHDVALIDPEGA